MRRVRVCLFRIATIQLAGLLKGRDGLGGNLKSIRGLAPPDLKNSIWNSFKPERRSYSTLETMQVLGIDNGRVQKLAKCADALEIRKPSIGRENRHYVADLIDSLRATKDASITFASITDGTGIPNYGVEQMAASGQLEYRDGEAMAIAYP